MSETTLNKSEYIVYGLRDFFAGIYSYDPETGKISYSQQTAIGHGISSTLGFRFAEGRLYSGGVLRRYKKKLTGGSVSIGVDVLTLAIQQMLYGAKDKEVTFTVNSGEKTVKNIGYGETTPGHNVGFAYYAPADDNDDSDSFFCIFVRKAQFGPPELAHNTENDSITWTTPTTTGEYIAPDHKIGDEAPLMVELTVVDTEEEAVAWCKTMLGMATPASSALNAETPAATPGTT